jgi:Sec-independent protein secretion pathway component TatC
VIAGSLSSILREVESHLRTARRFIVRILALFFSVLISSTALPFSDPRQFIDPTGGFLLENWFGDSISVWILRWSERYFLPSQEKIIALGPWDPFVIIFYVGAAIALAVTLPYLAWEAYRYVARPYRRRDGTMSRPVLSDGELRSVKFLLGLSSVLFFAGTLIAVLVLPYLYDFAYLLQGPTGLAGTISITEFVSETAFFCLGLGLAFEVPTISLCLAYFGVLTSGMMRGGARYALFGSFVVAFILSPGVFGGIVEIPMGFGLFGLYWGGYVLVSRVERARTSRGSDSVAAPKQMA